LLVAGKPFAAFAAAAPRVWRRVSAWPGGWRVVTSLSVAWGLHAAAIWVWHVPRLFDASVTNPWVHALQHASFLFSALVFWYALFAHQQRAMTIVYLLTTAIHTGVLGALLTFAPAPLYSAYADTTGAYGLTPLEDQQLGGLIMWVPAGFVLVFAGVVLFSRWLDVAARRSTT
ncbi:MAG: cytochrome c oxidase assembly protein, partial [Burkholderiaceae bacterium]